MSDLQDIISKATQMYIKKKYQLNTNSFLNFVSQKVNVDTFQLDCIKKKMISVQKQSTLTADDIRLFMHIVAAVQLKGDVSQLSIEQLTKYHKLSFKSTKKKRNQVNEQPIVKKVEYQQVKEDNQLDIQKINKQIKQTANLSQIQKKSQKQIEKQSYPSISVNLNQDKQNNNLLTKNNFNIQSQIKKQIKKQIDQKNNIKKKVQFQNMGPIKQQMNQSSNNYQLQLQGDLNQGAKFMQLDEQLNEKVKITQYQKVSQDFINTVIKYQIVYGEYRTWRRYSQFQKLMSYLTRKYEGIILPQMPPKEGIKGNFTYLLGLDESFLNNRQQKLQQLLKRLLNSKFIENDQVLHKFLTEETFEIELLDNQNGSYLKALTDIAFNAKQLKDYGMAYYKYIAQSKVQLKMEVSQKYASLESITKKFILLNQYRLKINSNFQKRRQIINFDGELKSRYPAKTQFDNILTAVSSQIIDLKNLFHKYVKLKSDESWLISLIEQKNSQPQKKQHEQKLKTTQQRISKMEENLIRSMNDFESSKSVILKKIGNKLDDWRWKIHP